ncbi:NADH dehydrogenase [ubiquinone] iron-sulfur protein 6, mitochondrial [Amphibalanus amphitrite]|uniref:NADH dehydrogenase [ubiquinone] iron-sulfur protein 6, mitochondrial n=1 Tax=Amphibalanus amphitrite TaxID=1232801 RepID=A0A6A4V5U1_AMPAM|nr:NADH dehydrogenase [ubiquinone] iron-sulfur protein 6, mitochondrial [Amphibalanus amphitrite]
MTCIYHISDHRGFLYLQAFAEDDYRLVRFTERTKQVNPQFAIDLIAQVPPKVCTERVVSCDGGGGALGHPKVFINLPI